ncbi:hypothetical protein AB0M36_25405 [Actinoplanes sp. NPDC051346]|uniref:hypothetical protein n=1 Tax=Actinoplanes sp. NPDC051346 TaxID=3155048 RepID=UPI00342722E5
MESQDLPDPLRARVGQQRWRPAMYRMRHFMQSYVADSDGTEEIYAEVRRTVITDASSVRQDLEAVEMVLKDEHVPGTLLRLVEGDGNRALDHPSDAEAAAFLHALAQLLRSALDQS